MSTQSSVERMPRNVKVALWVIWFQALLSVAAAVVILSVVSDAVDHGRGEGTGLISALAYLTFLTSALLVAAGIAAPRRFGWVRGTVVAVEVLNLVGGVIGLLKGGGVSLIGGIALGAAILRIFLSDEAKAWFSR